jgi:hypothetical protein
MDWQLVSVEQNCEHHGEGASHRSAATAFASCCRSTNNKEHVAPPFSAWSGGRSLVSYQFRSVENRHSMCHTVGGKTLMRHCPRLFGGKNTPLGFFGGKLPPHVLHASVRPATTIMR